MFNLPVAIEVDQARDFGLTPSNTLKATQIPASDDSPAQCLADCVGTSGCAAWSVSHNSTGATDICTLYNTAGLNEYRAGVTSGVRGTWSQTSPNCITLTRDGNGPMYGNLTLCGGTTDGTTVSFLGGNSLEAIWDQFEDERVGGQSGSAGNNAYGAVVVRTASGGLLPGQTAALTIALAWYFPARDCESLPCVSFVSCLLSLLVLFSVFSRCSMMLCAGFLLKRNRF